jgi:hypothetical protein
MNDMNARTTSPEALTARVKNHFGASIARIQEVHAVIIHCLCDLIDHQLLGPA